MSDAPPLHLRLIHIAPPPSLARLHRAHDRVRRVVEMRRRVLVLRRVAARDVTADQALPQVNPGIARFHAVLANVSRHRDRFDLA